MGLLFIFCQQHPPALFIGLLMHGSGRAAVLDFSLRSARGVSYYGLPKIRSGCNTRPERVSKG